MTPCWLLVLLCSPLWRPEGVEGWGSLSPAPSESECRPYIEKALKELSPETPQEAVDAKGSEHTTPPSQSADQEGSIEETEQATTKESGEGETDDEAQGERESTETQEATGAESTESTETTDTQEITTGESTEEEIKNEESAETEETKENIIDDQSLEEENQSTETKESLEASSREDTEPTLETKESDEAPETETTEEKSEEEELKSVEENIQDTPRLSELETELSQENEESTTAEEKSQEEGINETSQEDTAAEEVSGEENPDDSQETKEQSETTEDLNTSNEEKDTTDSTEILGGEVPDSGSEEATKSDGNADSEETSGDDSLKKSNEENTVEQTTEDESVEETTQTVEDTLTESSSTESIEHLEDNVDEPPAEKEGSVEKDSSKEEITISKESDTESQEEIKEPTKESGEQETSAEDGSEKESEDTEKESEPNVEDQLTLEFETPKVRRQREHVSEILKLTPQSAETELLLAKTIETTLKDLKKLYDAAIKPLEILYKYRDLSNRHFGDPEIFSKPLILFMGPWSGGKSTIVNYLLDNEFKTSSLRTGAEPSPAYFNILMWGEREEVLDGTQLAADWTFSGLQKFGQGLLDRLRGLKLNAPLLEKVNIVEIPGILEIRKQVERLFPFNDACQWFIDRADIIFLVYDPSKLDVGPETEAILDQLKGREYQTRIILNKADQVKPEELMRVQGTLIWNISPLMSSQEPPIMYSTSLWSVPYEHGAPTRLLHAQERAFLQDLRTAIDKRVENKIASARRFAVRVRNHAKMVDCYLTTYYNHKTFFGNRKKVADDIIEHPQNYHIYEGLSTLTNISRYDLPDPEVYRDFFRLNPVYDFQRLSDTCTYFRGCPINRLDVAIAYDLPELVGKYKKQAEKVLEAAENEATKS